MATVEDFKKYVADVQNRAGYTKPTAFGLGIRKTKGDKTLEVFYPMINFETAYGTAALLQDVTGYDKNSNGFVKVKKTKLQEAFDKFEAFHQEVEKHPNITLIHQLLSKSKKVKGYGKVDIIAYFLFDKDSAVETPEEGYFKTQCLSQLLVKPHQIGVALSLIHI